MKIMKENIYIISHISYNNSLFDFVFRTELKEADITPVYKKE